MTSPQPGIFQEGSRNHRFFEVILPSIGPETSRPDDSLRRLIGALEKIKQDASSRQVFQVLAFSKAFWSWLNPDTLPASMMDFPGYQCIDDPSVDRAASTQRQLFIWAHSSDADALVDVQLDILACLGHIEHQLVACDGFVYRDSRDLTGFVDGSANPKDEARYSVALVPEGEKGAGGSFVLTQRWQHSLEAFNKLPVVEQERVIGRTKPDSIELEGDAMPANSHVSRTDLKIDGVAQKIYRRSTPFIKDDNAGLFFLAFSADILRFDTLLKSMYGMTGDGVHDRLIEYSTARDSSYWFAPAQQDIDSIVE